MTHPIRNSKALSADKPEWENWLCACSRKLSLGLLFTGLSLSLQAQMRPPLDKLRSTLLDGTKNPNYVFLGLHRAAWTHGTPENSRASVDTALKDANVDIIEIDVKLSKDGKVYLLHDNYLQRSTNFLDVYTGSGQGTDNYGKYDQYTWAELSNLRLKNEERTYTDMKIPLLSEIFDAVRGRNVLLQIDVDNDYLRLDSSIAVARQKNALSFTMFKAAMTVNEFKPIFNKLTEEEKKQIIFVPIIRRESAPDGGTTANPELYYNQWKQWGLQNPAYKGLAGMYQIGYRHGGDVPLINLAAQIRADKKRLGTFAAQPEYYRGRYKGNVNINQCCADNPAKDRRGDWDFILAPNGNRNAGINGYIITDEETAFLEFFPNRVIQ